MSQEWGGVRVTDPNRGESASVLETPSFRLRSIVAGVPNTTAHPTLAWVRRQHWRVGDRLWAYPLRVAAKPSLCTASLEQGQGTRRKQVTRTERLVLRIARTARSLQGLRHNGCSHGRGAVTIYHRSSDSCAARPARG